MKFLDVLSAGKLGSTVFQGGRFGQIKRTLVIPVDPKTPIQIVLRDNLKLVTQSWRTLTDPERLVWIALAETVMSKPKGGDQGPLTGVQLYTKINCVNLLCGNDMVRLPSPKPDYCPAVATALSIANPAGVLALKLTTIGEPTQANPWIVRASPSQSPGCHKCDDLRIIGLAPAPQNGLCDVSALHSARFGQPDIGRKIWVSICATHAGWEDFPREFVQIVPPPA